jgi:hypothetical protein
MSFADRYVGSSGIDPPLINLRAEVKEVRCPTKVDNMANKTEKELGKPVPTNSAAKIREHLSVILTSEIFVRAERLSRFLRYVVERTLEGRGDEINEYSIGVEVYDRPTAFDPRVDSTVRVEAGRLRAKLREYYEAEGKDSAIRIQLPKGSYSPSFREIAPWSEEIEVGSDAAGRETLKSIAVLPFADLSPAHDQEYFGYGIAGSATTNRPPGRNSVARSERKVCQSRAAWRSNSARTAPERCTE